MSKGNMIGGKKVNGDATLPTLKMGQDSHTPQKCVWPKEAGKKKKYRRKQIIPRVSMKADSWHLNFSPMRPISAF